ncbi:Protein of unknown function [Bacillus cytotoxicus]|uniref:Uncharacterized protein n=1 Tax=Bacillus cytotoxicus TaxID=580165 RepID=A0AAX2CM84_9BACI|nr:Protein of unknown function [Bacillus cytotoxicus]SCN42327.1 Protein of unknown function [Bacillus cytotoxicus]
MVEIQITSTKIIQMGQLEKMVDKNSFTIK